MKKVLLAVSIASALSLANMAHAASGGTITFEGKIIDQTCQAGIDGSTNASATVKMGGVQKSDLATAGSVKGETPFTISLTGCKAQAAAWGVTAYFPDNAANIDSTNQVLKNQETGTGAATNVGLELLQVVNGVKTTVPLGKAVTNPGYVYFPQAATATSATLNYKVQYKAIGGAASEGKVKGLAVYELAYQ